MSTSSATRTIGIHSSSRAFGRSATGAPPAPVPGLAAGLAERGELRRVAGRDARLVRRRTGPRRTGRARRDRPAGTSAMRRVTRRHAAPADEDGDDDAPGADGRATAAASGSGMPVDAVHAEQVGLGERHARGVLRRGDELVDRSVGPRRRGAPVAPAGIGSVTGCAGRDRLRAARPTPPSSSPVRFARRIGNATWSGRSDRRGSNARTAVGTAVAAARVEERRRRSGPG